MISVILTTHHGRKDTCQAAIKSVLNQTFTDYELIVVDDASHDGTKEMVEGIDDPRIKYIRRTRCFGNDTLPKNRGIKASTGEYIAFLDSDNTYRPDHLQVLYNAITTNDVEGVYGDRMIIDKVKNIPPHLGNWSEFSPTMLLHKNFIDTSDILIKREVLFAVGGFDERYSKYVDWNLWLRIAKAGYRLKHVPLIITDYYYLSDSKSIKKQTKKEIDYMKTHDGVSPNLPDWDAHELEIHLPYLMTLSPPKIAIFTLTHDRLDYTKRCFESLHKTAGYAFDHFVVDNGSKDYTASWIFEYANQHKNDFFMDLLPNPDNHGISKASNEAIDMINEHGEYDIIVKVDNDCLFLTDGWLAKMVEIWKVNHMIAMSCYVQGLKDNPGGSPRIAYGNIKDEVMGMTKHLGGICHFVDAKAYNTFRWDEDDTLHGVQDLIFSHHLLNTGYQMGYLENYYCEHMDGTEGQHKRYPDYFERRKTERVISYETNR
jgi:glycosyltransferase involved in cell wall biosynthesis